MLKRFLLALCLLYVLTVRQIILPNHGFINSVLDSQPASKYLHTEYSSVCLIWQVGLFPMNDITTVIDESGWCPCMQLHIACIALMHVSYSWSLNRYEECTWDCVVLFTAMCTQRVYGCVCVASMNNGIFYVLAFCWFRGSLSEWKVRLGKHP